VAHDIAALGKQIFNVSKTHGKPAIGPHNVSNDFGRKKVALEGAGLFVRIALAAALFLADCHAFTCSRRLF